MSLNLFAGHGVFLRFVFMGAVSKTLNYALPVDHGRDITGVKVMRLMTAYASYCFFMISLLVWVRRGSWLIGKDPKTGQLPLWSMVLWWPFHGCNRLFAQIAKYRHRGEVATEVFQGYYVGGWFSNELEVNWEAVVDLTAELPELCKTENYLNLGTWDGVVRVEDVAEAATFLAKHAKKGAVLVHCAHGVGRSTTIMRAALVEAGHFQDTVEAFNHIKTKRPMVKNNAHFQSVLDIWEKARK